MNIDDMIFLKKEYGYSCEYIAEQSGVPFSTVQKVFAKTTPTPRRKTLDALRKVFEPLGNADVMKNDQNTSDNCQYDSDSEDNNDISYVCEDETEYAVDGTNALKIKTSGMTNKDKTLEDYLALPEGVRVELIDGVFYDMASPRLVHQRISGLIYTSIDNYIKTNKGLCVPFNAPTDVQIDYDNKTVVIPDILVVCDRDKLKGPRVMGAPDFIIEVLSPSNWYHDMVRKLIKYKNAGVREYWIVNPENFTITVYYFSESDLPKEYSFDDEVPVAIWDGNCKISFKEIYEQISFMLE